MSLRNAASLLILCALVSITAGVGAILGGILSERIGIESRTYIASLQFLVASLLVHSVLVLFARRSITGKSTTKYGLGLVRENSPTVFWAGMIWCFCTTIVSIFLSVFLTRLMGLNLLAISAIGGWMFIVIIQAVPYVMSAVRSQSNRQEVGKSIREKFEFVHYQQGIILWTIVIVLLLSIVWLL